MDVCFLDTGTHWSNRGVFLVVAAGLTEDSECSVTRLAAAIKTITARAGGVGGYQNNDPGTVSVE